MLLTPPFHNPHFVLRQPIQLRPAYQSHHRWQRFRAGGGRLPGEVWGKRQLKVKRHKAKGWKPTTSHEHFSPFVLCLQPSIFSFQLITPFGWSTVNCHLATSHIMPAGYQLPATSHEHFPLSTLNCPLSTTSPLPQSSPLPPSDHTTQTSLSMALSVAAISRWRRSTSWGGLGEKTVESQKAQGERMETNHES